MPPKGWRKNAGAPKSPDLAPEKAEAVKKKHNLKSVAAVKNALKGPSSEKVAAVHETAHEVSLQEHVKTRAKYELLLELERLLSCLASNRTVMPSSTLFDESLSATLDHIDRVRESLPFGTEVQVAPPRVTVEIHDDFQATKPEAPVVQPPAYGTPAPAQPIPMVAPPVPVQAPAPGVR